MYCNGGEGIRDGTLGRNTLSKLPLEGENTV